MWLFKVAIQQVLNYSLQSLSMWEDLPEDA